MSEWIILNNKDEIDQDKKQMRILVMQNNQITDNIIKLNDSVLRLKKKFKEEIESIKSTLIDLNNNIEELKKIIKKS